MLDPSEHAKRRNPIEEFLRYVPGFRGYLEMQHRRESDELTRQWLADQLERSKRTLANVTQPLVEKGQIDLLPQIDRLRGRLDRLIARIRGAMQGYSGFFDLVTVDQDLLDQVYLYDLDLMEHVETLVQTVEQLPAKQDRLPQALEEARSQVDQADRAWDRRDEILREQGRG